MLGSLFCKLARAKVARSARAHSAAGELNAALHRHPQRALAFSAAISPKAATASAKSCEVLDLIVGPLSLNLLGLVVDLNQVHLRITATRGGGKLGDIFCQLADDYPGPTTTTPP